VGPPLFQIISEQQRQAQTVTGNPQISQVAGKNVNVSQFLMLNAQNAANNYNLS